MKSDPQAKLPLHRMAVFTPGRQNDDEIRASYIARPALLDLLLEDIRNTRPKSIPQHHLIIGQRGMGKTTLLKRLHVALREEPFSEQFIPLGFPEEQYSVDRLSTVFLNSLDALADTLEHEEKSQNLIDRIDESVERLRRDSAADEIVAQDAERTLMEIAAETGRRPVLLMDNLNLIFDRLKKPELHHLRAFLMKNGAPILIGAAVHPPEDNYEAPFYDHFKPHFLNRLSLPEMREVLLRLAERVENKEIPARLDHEKGRLHALHALTGGNPRTTRILFEIFAHGFSQEAYEDLEALLDWMTPIYKARFEELSDQAQVVVSAIATIWEPAMLRSICEATRLQSNQVSPQLDRLKKAGVIEEVTIDPPDRVGPIPDRRTPKDRTGYQLAERFFNIWFLMRQATRRDKRNLIYLTRLIECLHSPQERQQMASDLLGKAALCRADQVFGLALEPTLMSFSQRADLRDHKVDEATDALEQAIATAEGDAACARCNLAYLLATRSGDFAKAAVLLSEAAISKESMGIEDGIELISAVVDALQSNWGDASRHLQAAFVLLGARKSFPSNTIDDWMRASAVMISLDLGRQLLALLESTGFDHRLRPWTEALRAHVRGDRKYLRNAPAEVSESAGQLFDEIAVRMRGLPQNAHIEVIKKGKSARGPNRK